MIINLKDNTEYNSIDNEIIIKLQKITGQIKDIKSDLLVSLYDDNNFNDFEILTITGDEGRGYKLKTGNICGFINVNDLQICITTRSFNSVKSDKIIKLNSFEQDYFLQYMLSKAISPKFEFTNNSNMADNSPLFDFLILLFPKLLNEAFCSGIFRTYVHKKFNNSNVKGSIDIPRFIKNDIPFNGKIAYNTRELTSNNYLIQLVRYTIDCIQKSNYSVILQNDLIKDIVEQVINITSATYSPRDLFKIINKNLKPLNHPYYTLWRKLQELCIMILLDKKMSYAEGNHSIYGVIFDVSNIWEEYIWTILKEYDFVHTRYNSTGKSENGLRMFTSISDTDESEKEFKELGKCYRKIYPDFYKKECVILDTKYKDYGNKSFAREDLYQIITYMHTMNIKNGGFVFPVSSDRLDNEKSKINKLQLNGDCFGKDKGGYVRKIAFYVPNNKNDSFEEFIESIKISENDFKSKIKELINDSGNSQSASI